jgi:hypothetical protein
MLRRCQKCIHCSRRRNIPWNRERRHWLPHLSWAARWARHRAAGLFPPSVTHPGSGLSINAVSCRTWAAIRLRSGARATAIGRRGEAQRIGIETQVRRGRGGARAASGLDGIGPRIEKKQKKDEVRSLARLSATEVETRLASRFLRVPCVRPVAKGSQGQFPEGLSPCRVTKWKGWRRPG